MSVILNGSNQCLYSTPWPWAPASYPFSISIWFKPDDANTTETMASIEAAGSNDKNIVQARGGVAGDYLAAATYGTGWALAYSSAGFSASTWQHALGVFNSDTDRRIYLDGVNKGTDSTNQSGDDSLTTLCVGIYGINSKTNWFAGRLAELAIWDVALDDDDATALAAGTNPQEIEADNLIQYNTLESNATATVGSNLTEYGNPTYDTEDDPEIEDQPAWKKIAIEQTSPVFNSVTFSGATASRLLATGASNNSSSVTDLTAWVAGTANRVTVTDDTDGTITLSGPQDLATASSPTFAELTLSGDNIVFTNAGNNIGIGTSGIFGSITNATYNFCAGYDAGLSLTEGDYNTYIGNAAGNKTTTGSYNFGLGSGALYWNQTGGYNVAIGRQAIFGASGQSCNYNVAIGNQAGYGITTGSQNVLLGYQAGYRQTTSSNLLIIDNQDRSSTANELAKSMLYGTFAAAVADQWLRVNGELGINVSPDAQLHVDQSVNDAAKPVLILDQADVSEEFIKFIGSAASGVLTQSIVAAGDVGTATVAGYLKVNVQDDGNQIADQAYYMAIYTLAAP